MPRIIENLYAATLAAIIAIGTPIAAFAFDQNSAAEVNVDSAGVGIKGFDPVAYFTVGKPTPGDKLYSATHAGVTYHFASARNRDLFKADPNKYAPAYGGFCAMGVALEKKFDGDPQAWYLKPGDVMECEIEGIGVLRNPVISWKEAHGIEPPPFRKPE